MAPASQQQCVLVGLDEEDPHWRVLRQAADLAGRLGAPLEVVHILTVGEVVGDLPAVLGGTPIVAAGAGEGLEREMAERLRSEITPILEQAGVRWELCTRRGEPAAVLLEAAEEIDAYCIVVGSRGEGVKAFFKRFFAPSVSHALIGEGHRPVVVVGALAPAVVG